MHPHEHTIKIMVTNVHIDQEKLSQIMSMQKFKSKQKAINEALSAYLKSLLHQEVLAWKGTDFWEGYLAQIRTNWWKELFLTHPFG